MSTNPTLHRPPRPRRGGVGANGAAPGMPGRELLSSAANGSSGNGIVPTTLNSVRRTLFSSSSHHHHRLAPSNAQAMANHGSKAAITVREDQRAAVEIVERDEQGGVVLDGLNMAVFPREDRLEEEREMESTFIAEMYREYQGQRYDIEASDLNAVLQSALKVKVMSLDEDSWMFEADTETPEPFQ